MTKDKKADLTTLKENGFIPQKQKDFFSLRIKTVGGMIDVEKLEAVCNLAKNYGKQYVHMTSRQSIEIPYISLDDVDSIKEEMKQNNLEPGRLGSALRTVSACQGNAICGSGLIDTTQLAIRIEEQFKNFQLPHKFKIGVTGCANNCLKAEENDLGIKGAFSPEWDSQNCVYCGACSRRCPTSAIEVDKKEKTLKFNQKNCIHCGRCKKVCPKNCWQGKNGFQIYYGGIFGRKIKLGLPLLEILFNENKIFSAIQAGIDFFAEHGKAGERFAFTIERIGLNNFINLLKERGLPLRAEHL